MCIRDRVVDGLFGSGRNKPLAGGFAAMVKYINQSPAKVVSIDIPSGLMTEDVYKRQARRGGTLVRSILHE